MINDLCGHVHGKALVIADRDIGEQPQISSLEVHRVPGLLLQKLCRLVY